jgi:hypothetical protein
MGKKEQHNGVIKYAPEKNEFLGRNILTCGTEKMHIYVLSTKTRNMHDDWTSVYDMMYDVRHLCVCEIFLARLHICVLIDKTNIC